MLCLWSAIAGPAGAQRYPGRSYATEDGLPSPFVLDLAQDHHGRIWILTRGGLAVHDGHEWTRVDTSTLTTPYRLQWLAVDPEEGAWVTRNVITPVLLRFDGERWRELPETTVPMTQGGEILDLVAFREHGQSTVALATSKNGLLLWRQGSVESLSTAEGLAGTRVSALLAEGSRLYIGTDAGLFALEGGKLVDLRSGSQLPAPPIRALALERRPQSTRIWILGQSSLGYLEDGQFHARLDGLSFDPNSTSLLQGDGAGGVCFTDGRRMWRLTNSGRLEHFGPSQDLPLGALTALALDWEDNVWVAGHSGLRKFTGWRFANIGPHHGLFDEEVTAIVERRSGEMVFAHTQGLTFYDGQRLEPWPLHPPENPSPFLYRVFDMTEDASENLWLATGKHGLARLDKRREVHWLRFDDIIGTTAVYFSRQSGLLVGAITGLFRLEGEALVPEGVAGAQVRLITDASEGRLIAASNQGLWVREGGAWRNVRASGEPSGNDIYTVYEDRHGTLWAGTQAGLLEARAGELERPTVAALRIERPVYTVLEDSAGVLWVGTDRGIFTWDGEGIRQFTIRDGFAGHETNRAAALIDRHGDMWIGTDLGVSRHDPRLEPSQISPPRVSLREAEVGGHAYDLRRPLDLGYHQRNLSLTAHALSLRDESRVRFRHRLLGLDEHWAEAQSGTRFTIHLSHLPPGEYRWQIQARGIEGGWSPLLTSPPITIARPYWQRSWFYALVLSAFALLAWLLHKFASGRKFARRLQEEVRLRTTELAVSREAIAAEKERLDVTLGSILEGVIATDRDGRIALLNKAAAQIFGRDRQQALGHLFVDLAHLRNDRQPDDPYLDPVQVILDRGEPVEFLSIYRLDRSAVGHGSGPLLELTGAPVRLSGGHIVGVVLACRDVTQRQILEQEVARAQKLDSLGVLAGGIAHDFNNLLTGILANLSLATLNRDLPPSVRSQLEAAETALTRAEGLARQLLTFSAGGAPVTGPAVISELIRETAEFVFHGAQTNWQADLPGDLWPVEIDSQQIHQVLSNLLINARQAMTERGTMRIEARNVGLDLGQHPTLDAGRYVRLKLRDEGPGINAEILPNIFDPYFTTKKKGNGLGLATSFSIVKRHQGALEVQSEVGRGTCFIIHLPVSERRARAATMPKQANPTGTGRILVMDDEATIRQVLEDILGRQGYETLVVSDGQEAIAGAEQALRVGQPLDLGILDLTVPGGMGGMETALKLKAMQPRLPLVASSGYSQQPMGGNYGKHGFEAFLAKPYRAEQVARLIADLLPGD